MSGVIPILKNNRFSINHKRIAPAYKKAEIVLYVINCIKLAGKVIDMVYTKFTFCILLYAFSGYTTKKTIGKAEKYSQET